MDRQAGEGTPAALGAPEKTGAKAPLWTRLSAWVASAVSVGVGISIAIHIALILLAAVMSVGYGTASAGGGHGAKDYDLTESEAELTGLADAPLDAAAPAAADTDLADVPTSGVMEGAGGVDAPASGAGLGEVADGLGGAGGGDIGEGEGLGAGGAGGGGTSFFGVEAKGSRFAYIVDVSGSMEGNKIAALKVQLNESIGSLLEHMSFFVVAFSNAAQPLGDRHKWTSGNTEGKKWSASGVSQLRAFGGTEPWPAFDAVFSMKPTPDAIYFMTDGLFDASVADSIAGRNRGAKKVPIHCIAFGDGSSEELMRRIAGQSGGTYTFVRGPR